MESKEVTDEEIARSLKTCGKASSCTERCAFYLQNSCIKKMCTEGAKLIRRLKKENAELQKQVDELTKPIGKFKDQTALKKAYESLEKEFTRKIQQLKELQNG